MIKLVTKSPMLALVLASCLCTMARGDDAADQYAVAAGHYARGRWTLAVEEFESFLEQYPDHEQNGPALFFLGEALVQLGKFEEARGHFESLLADHPDTGYRRLAKFRSGETVYLTGDYKLAKQRLTEFSDEFPSDALHEYVLPYLAEIAAADGETAQAEKLFRKALLKYPHGVLQDDCRYGLARSLERQQQTDEAYRLYLAVAAKPQAPLADHAQFRLGCLEYGLGKFDDALASFAELEKRFPNSVHVARSQLGRGRALFQLKRWEEAEAIFAQSHQAGELPVESAYWLGVTQKARGNLTAAANTLLASANHPEAAELAPAMYFHAGDALRLAEQHAAAQKQFDHILKEWPNSDWADDSLLGQARIALAQSKYADVESLTQTIEQKYSGTPIAHEAVRVHCQALLQQERGGEAVPLLQELLKNPVADSHVDQELLAVALVADGKFDSALENIRQLLDSQDPLHRADANLVYATALVGLDRHAEAIVPLETFLAARPGDERAVTAWAELSICCLVADRYEKSRTAYQELLKHSQDNEQLPRVTLRLADESLARQHYDWAAELYARLVKLSDASDSERARGWSGLAWTRFRQDRIDEAKDAFFELLARYPESKPAAEAALVTGQLLERQQQYDGALAQYYLAAQQYPGTAEATSSLLAAARLHVRTKQHQEAATLFGQVAKIAPEHAEMAAILYEWSWTCRDLGDTAQADKLLSRLHEDFPQSSYWPDATYRLANGAFERGELEAAQCWLDALLQYETGDEILQYALYLQGRLYMQQQQWEALDATVQRLVNEVPSSHLRLAAEYYQIEALYRQEKFVETVQHCRQLLPRLEEVKQDWVSIVSLRLAQSLASQNEWNEAQEIVTKLAEIDAFAQVYEAQYLLARCLARRADFDGARSAYRQVLQAPAGRKTETAAMAQWMIGETFFHQKQYAAALREYLRVEILYAYPTWQAASLLQAAKCYEQLGEWSEAIGLYQRLVTEFPESTFTAEAVKRLPNAKRRL